MQNDHMLLLRHTCVKIPLIFTEHLNNWVIFVFKMLFYFLMSFTMNENFGIKLRQYNEYLNNTVDTDDLVL